MERVYKSLSKTCISRKGLKGHHTGLAGIELYFFTVVGMVLSFGFVTKRVLIKHKCFSYC